MTRLWVCASAVCLICGACQTPPPRLNAPPHGQTDNPSPLQDTFAAMEDNALLADMTVSDVHFIPHRPILTSLGEERICRLASVLDMYGGTVRFYSSDADPVLIQQRLEAVKAALADEGVDSTSDVVTRDLPGGRGIDAPQAILIRAKEGTYSPKKQSGESSGQTAAPAKKSN